ncbi:hypothetical protein [Amycolatopsis sp. NPDC051061]|uniref:hypothetical protein n=1 Tax=Amycolatopsis sp. NPDC051061 TaxID=3155042 RepID=UPI003436B6F0
MAGPVCAGCGKTLPVQVDGGVQRRTTALRVANAPGVLGSPPTPPTPTCSAYSTELDAP